MVVRQVWAVWAVDRKSFVPSVGRWLLEVDQVGVVIRSGGAPSASMKTAFIDIRNFRTERYGCERLMPLG